MLSIAGNATMMAKNLTVPFSGFGGTPPYAYTVLDGGIGGSIDPATGVYTSPNSIGIDTLQVSDSLNAVAQTQITVGTVLEFVSDIIENQLGLAKEQVYLWDQKVDIPHDERLYVSVGMLSCKPFGNNRTYDSSGVNSIQTTNFMATLDIDIFSRGLDALNRKEEVLMALKSNYAEAQQELNSFYIAPLSISFLNLSEAEGAAILYRFKISVNVQYAVTKIVPVSYFDSFQTPNILTDP